MKQLVLNKYGQFEKKTIKENGTSELVESLGNKRTFS